MIVRRLMVCLLATTIACGERSEPEPAVEPEPVAENGGAPSVARWAEVRVAGDRALLEAPARVVAGPGAMARVAPPFAARVLEVRVAPGDSVRAGDVLLEASMPEVLDAAAIWVAGGRRLALREARQDELEALREEGLVEQGRVFEQAASLADLGAERARALAILRAAGVSAGRAAAVLSRGSVPIVSPIDGVVSRVDARIGEVRDPAGEPLVEVIGSAPVRIEARLSRAMPEGTSLMFVPAIGAPVPLRDEPDASAIDPADGTRLYWITPRETTTLADGLRGTLEVHVAREGVLQVPAGAIGHDDEGAFVMLRGTPEPVRVRVRVLATDAGIALVEVIEPGALSPGAQVADDPAALLRAPAGDDH
ncbi:efflux RND transporter periplasmic adaptor subunit [Sandaracinus amylolyticus]|nr:efflux RND transporter periplasmic adaptor subunit [Sandaracinus amylolyticus]